MQGLEQPYPQGQSEALNGKASQLVAVEAPPGCRGTDRLHEEPEEGNCSFVRQ